MRFLYIRNQFALIMSSLFTIIVKFNCQIVSKCNSTTQFDCGSHCIALSQVCDGHIDCGDHEDEPQEYCNKNECKESNGGCSHQCIDLLIGYECNCPNGFELGSNLKTCKDIDECQEPGACSQLCLNTKGGYKCECIDGYLLELNHRRCHAKEGKTIILFAHRTDIRKIDTQTKECVSIVSNLRSTVALDYDYHTGSIIWSDVADGAIKSVPIDTGMPVTTLVSEDLDTVEGLAVDWIYGHIYWTDTDKDTIEVADRKGRFRKILISEDLNEPRAIVLDPFEGWIYWADWGLPARIERAGMDGTHRETIVSVDIKWPNGLAIDFVQRKIFWADAKLHLLSSVDYTGENRQDIVSSPIVLEHPFSIDVFEDWVYWSDWESEGIHKINKFNGKEKSNIVTSISYPMDIHIYHPYKQPKGVNHCAKRNGDCSHLCLPSPNISALFPRYTCACPDEMRLAADNENCIPEYTKNNTSVRYTFLVTDIDITSKENVSSEIFIVENRLETLPGIIIGLLIGLLILLILAGFLIFKYYPKKNITILNFNNPVYKKTSEDQFSLEWDQYQPAGSYPPHLEPLASPETNNFV